MVTCRVAPAKRDEGDGQTLSDYRKLVMGFRITLRRIDRSRSDSLVTSGIPHPTGDCILIRLKQQGIIVGAIALGVLACIAVATLSAQQAAKAAVKVDANILKNAGTPNDSLPGSWLSYGRSQGETRYSPLTQINTSNV